MTDVQAHRLSVNGVEIAVFAWGTPQRGHERSGKPTPAEWVTKISDQGWCLVLGFRSVHLPTTASARS